MEERSFLNQLIDIELKWLAGFQLPNGALPMVPLKKGRSTKICPYFSEFTALALMLRPDQYGDCVRRYMDWHLRQLNSTAADYNGIDGTIYDYIVGYTASGGMQESIPLDPNTGKLSYDSTDSYAALFLELIWTYSQKTGDKVYIRQHRNEVLRIVSAMLSTLDGGLTWAKLDWKVKYLMDNCEVIKGLRAAQSIYAFYYHSDAHDAEEKDEWSSRIKKLADTERKMLRRIEQLLWKENEQCYLIGIMEKEVPVPQNFCWDTFYPDALAQLFPILMGILPSDSPRAIHLYEEFNRHFSNETVCWEEMRGEKLGSYYINGLIPLTAIKMNDTERVRRFCKNYDELISKAGHPDPAYNADCAQVAMAAAALLEQSLNRLG